MIEPLPKEIETKVSYHNPLVLGERAKNVDNTMKMIQAAIGIVGQEQVLKELKVEKVIPYLVKNLNATTEIFKSDSDKQQEQAQQGASQMMDQFNQGMNGNGAVSGAMDSSDLGSELYSGGVQNQ